MATSTTRRRGSAAAKKAKPEPEVEDIEEIDDLELDDVDDEEDDDEVEEKPAPKRGATSKKSSKSATKTPAKPAAKKDEVRGTQWLTEHVNAKLGTEYKAFDLRVALRKLAKSGDLVREVGTDKSRYEFDGPNDPVVVALIKMLKSGALDKEKKEKLEQLKSRKASKNSKSKVVEDDEVGDDLLGDDEVEELDDDE